MKYLIVSLALIVGLACAPKNANLSPAGREAYTADQIVIRLGELQDAAIAANKSGGLADGPAIKIVQFTVDGAKTCKAVPAGWQATLKAGWLTLKAQLDAAVRTKLGAAWAVLDAILGGA